MSQTEVGEQRWNDRVNRWTGRTQTPLNVLALLTIWLSVTPINVMLGFESHRVWWLIGRGLLSFIYAIDIVTRAVLSKRPLRYIAAHPLSALVVLFPPLRLVFSIRLMRTMFSKGNLVHFLAVAVLLVLNGAVLVVIFEHSAPNASITSIPIALWWTACTVSTVGYGDYTPVTVGGRIVAVCIMIAGLTSVAVITAQIASSFMDQASVRREEKSEQGDTDEKISESVGSESEELERHHRLIERLQAIETLLRSEERT
jgi:voltage-gated potassium channel